MWLDCLAGAGNASMGDASEPPVAGSRGGFGSARYLFSEKP